MKLIVKIILLIALIGCLFHMPYGFYQLVRIIGMAGFAWLAYKDSYRANKSLMILWIVSALLINPILKVPLGRHIWNLVDVVWVIILLITIWRDVRVKKKKVSEK